MIQKDLNIQLGKMLGLSISKTQNSAAGSNGSFWGFLVKNFNSITAEKQPQTLKLKNDNVSLSLKKQDKLTFNLGHELKEFRNKISGLKNKQGEKLAELDDKQLGAVWITGKALESVVLQPTHKENNTPGSEISDKGLDTTIIQVAGESGHTMQLTAVSETDGVLTLSGDSTLLSPFQKMLPLMRSLFPALAEQKIVFSASAEIQLEQLAASPNAAKTGQAFIAETLENIDTPLKTAFEKLAQSAHPLKGIKTLYSDSALKIEASNGKIIVQAQTAALDNPAALMEAVLPAIKKLMPNTVKNWPVEVKQPVDSKTTPAIKASSEGLEKLTAEIKQPLKETLANFAQRVNPEMAKQKIYSNQAISVEAKTGTIIARASNVLQPAAKNELANEIRAMLPEVLKNWPVKVEQAAAPAADGESGIKIKTQEGHLSGIELPLKKVIEGLNEKSAPSGKLVETPHLRVEIAKGNFTVTVSDRLPLRDRQILAERIQKLLPTNFKDLNVEIKTSAAFEDVRPQLHDVPQNSTKHTAKSSNVHVLSFQMQNHVEKLNLKNATGQKTATGMQKQFEVRLVSEHIEVKPLAAAKATKLVEKTGNINNNSGKTFSEFNAQYSGIVKQTASEGFGAGQQSTGDSWKGFAERGQTIMGGKKPLPETAPVTPFGSEMQMQETAASEKVKVLQTVQKIVEVIENYKRLNKSASEVRMMVVTEKTGEMEVRVRDGRQASLIMMVENETIRQEVIRLLPQIQESLDDKGLSFGAVQVDVGQSRDGENGKSSDRPEGGHVEQKQEGKDDVAAKRPQQKRFGYNTMEVIA